MARFGVLLFFLPFLELFGLLGLGRWAGFGPVLLLVLGSGALGLLLIRRAGLTAVLAAQGDLLRGRVPARSLLDGVTLFGAGVLLMVPGLLTDFAGLLLLLPPTRALLYRWGQVRLAAGLSRGTIRLAHWRASGPPAVDAGSGVGPGAASGPTAGGAERIPRPGEIIQ